MGTRAARSGPGGRRCRKSYNGSTIGVSVTHGSAKVINETFKTNGYRTFPLLMTARKYRPTISDLILSEHGLIPSGDFGAMTLRVRDAAISERRLKLWAGGGRIRMLSHGMTLVAA